MSNLQPKEKTVATNNNVPVLMDELEKLRDEVRVRIHLGGMELRDAFDKVESEADHLVAQLPPAASRVLSDLAARLRRIAHALDNQQ